MSLVSLGVVGKDNDPLFLREFSTVEEEDDDDEKKRDVVDNDPYGFFSARAGQRGESSLRHQFIVHAALDRFEELTGPASGSRWRSPGSTGPDAMWVGLLSPVEDMRVYGYVTNTGVKFIGVIEDTDEVGGQHQQMRETELKNLFANLHNLYVEYTLNPFTKLKSPIVSHRFESKVVELAKSFNGK